MEVFEAVFFTKDSGNDNFIILKNGECCFENRRCVAFDSCKNIQYGDKILIQLAENGEEFEDNPYFKIIEKLPSNFREREKNLYSAIELFIKNAYSTEIEVNHSSIPSVNGVKFAESFYYEEVGRMFDSIIKLYRKEKMTKCVNYAKKILDDFEINATNTLGRSVNDNGSFDEYSGYIANIRKQHFNMFTSSKKIIEKIHEMIKNDALEKLQKVKNFALENCSKMEK